MRGSGADVPGRVARGVKGGPTQFKGMIHNLPSQHTLPACLHDQHAHSARPPSLTLLQVVQHPWQRDEQLPPRRRRHHTVMHPNWIYYPPTPPPLHRRGIRRSARRHSSCCVAVVPVKHSGTQRTGQGPHGALCADKRARHRTLGTVRGAAGPRGIQARRFGTVQRLYQVYLCGRAEDLSAFATLVTEQLSRTAVCAKLGH